MNTVSEAIETLCKQFADPKERWRALRGVKWVLQSPTGQYAGLDGSRCALYQDVSKAQMFDGRDNERNKAQFYSEILKVQLQPVLVSHAC